MELEDGKPCSHPGCLHHRTHPCEGCGRIGGKVSEVMRSIRKERKAKGWKPMSEAPRDGSWIVLLMDSGYTTTPYALVIAQFVPEYAKCEEARGWRDHANDSVFDRFEEIIAWREWKIPKIPFDPATDGYIMLSLGEEIQAGDEFKRDEGVWISFSQGEINKWTEITGKKLTRSDEGVPVRRKVK
jgi:hypothetical protein